MTDCILHHKATQDGTPILLGGTARRIIYETLIGPIPPRHQVIPQCGNRLCVNPEHLALRHINAPRPELRGRREPGKGPRLTPDQVAQIRAHPGTTREIATHFQITRRTVIDIKKHRTHK